MERCAENITADTSSSRTTLPALVALARDPLVEGKSYTDIIRHPGSQQTVMRPEIQAEATGERQRYHIADID
jgi:hypothetical protein